MVTKQQLIKQIEALGIRPDDTLMIHSSMKAIGEVDGGADTVLDAFSEYLQAGLLILPTHTWAQMSDRHPVFDPQTEPSCVGILTNLFFRRPGVVRSLHPTHSVAALGKDAPDYVRGEEKAQTPCPWEGCWGRLYSRKAKILFLGCSLKRNTFLHSVEERNHIPQRLTPYVLRTLVKTPQGKLLHCLVRRHYHPTCPDISANYDKMEPVFFKRGISVEGRIGNARSVLCNAVGMADLVSEFLGRNPDLFVDDQPIPKEWY